MIPRLTLALVLSTSLAAPALAQRGAPQRPHPQQQPQPQAQQLMRQQQQMLKQQQQQVEKMRKQQVQATIRALEQQIAVLRKQRAATLQSIRATFRLLIEVGHVDQQELDLARRQLVTQRDEMLAQAKTKADKTKVNEQFDPLLRALRAGGQLDDVQIEDLRIRRRVIVLYAENQYDAYIQLSQQQLLALRTAAK